MSDPTLDPALLLVALSTAFAGSLHCAGMCGPLRFVVAEHRHGRWLYQAGRLTAYLLLGAAAGALGWSLPPWVSIVFLLLAVAAIVFPQAGLPSAWRQRAFAVASTHPWLLGFSSGILPCGLLHAWIASAAATRNPVGGAALLAILWVGSAPALELAPLVARRWLQLARARYPRALPLLLLLIALLPVLWRMQPVSSEGKPACHHHHGAGHSVQASP